MSLGPIHYDPLTQDEKDAVIDFSLKMARLGLRIVRMDVEPFPPPKPVTRDCTFQVPTGRLDYKRTF